jgi:hypothetical protein
MPLYPLLAVYVLMCFVVFGKAVYETFVPWRYGFKLDESTPYDGVLALACVIVYAAIWPVTLVVLIANGAANWWARHKRSDDRLTELERFRIEARVASGCSLGATDGEVLVAIKRAMCGEDARAIAEIRKAMSKENMS